MEGGKRLLPVEAVPFLDGRDDVEKRQALDAVRPIQCQAIGDPRAPVVADQGEALMAQRPHQPRHHRRHVPLGIASICLVRLDEAAVAIARQIGQDEGERFPPAAAPRDASRHGSRDSHGAAEAAGPCRRCGNGSRNRRSEARWLSKPGKSRSCRTLARPGRALAALSSAPRPGTAPRAGAVGPAARRSCAARAAATSSARQRPSPTSFSDAHHVAHLVMQEGARRGMDADLLALALDLEPVQRLHRRGRLADRGAEAGEIMAARPGAGPRLASPRRRGRPTPTRPGRAPAPAGRGG